jgi:hypothetical protein
MASPFPGFDPFLEDQGYWRQFHTTFLAEALYSLADRLPDTYAVVIEERVSLVYEGDGDPFRELQPDAMILRSPRPSSAPSAPAGTATLEPVLGTLPDRQVEEVIEKRLEIRLLPDRELVTAIELLSPSNKRLPGAPLYIDKRDDLIQQEIHLVELDLLIAGKRLPMKDNLPPGQYYAFVSRAERRPISEIYVWTMRDLLPPIPIPLKVPDPDIMLDLAATFSTVYERSRVERLIDYTAPLKLPLNPEDRAWAESLARSAVPHQPPR